MQFYVTEYHQIFELLQKERNGANPYAVRRACQELARLVMWQSSVRLRIAEDDLLRTLQTIILLHCDRDAAVVVDCCRFLRRCISLKEPTDLDIQSRVTEAGYLTVFRSALAAHGNGGPLFSEICRLLAVQCFDMPHAPHADNQAEIIDSGLFKAIVDTLQRPSTTEEVAVLACEAVIAVIYENETSTRDAVEGCALIQVTADLLERFPSSKHILLVVTRVLFQIAVGYPEAQDAIVDSSVLERVLDFLEAHPKTCDVDTLWHAVKFIELVSRENDTVKTELCRCKAPLLLIQCIQHIEVVAHRKSTEQLLGVYFATCIIFSRLALSDETPSNGMTTWSVVESRVIHLMQAGAHQFALHVLKVVGSRHTHIAEQAVRVLELIASLEENRIPLTRLGASRQVKVVYNSTSHRGLMCMCERAIAAIEGT